MENIYASNSAARNLACLPERHELGVVGNTISGKAWKVGTAEPASPQFSTVDLSVLGPGQIALTNDVPTALIFSALADASFDNVEFIAIPEPSTLAHFNLLGLLGVGFLRRNH